jgi:hypothetical protein
VIVISDALQDFGKPPPVPKAKGSRKGAHQQQGNSAALGSISDDMSQVWTEEFIKEATAQFEKKMRECLSTQGIYSSTKDSWYRRKMWIVMKWGCGGFIAGAPSGVPSPASLKAADNLSKVVETATKAAVGDSADPTGIASQINESLKHFAAGSENMFGVTMSII